MEQKAQKEEKKPEFSQNEICEKHGISPSSVSKQMTGKVKGYRPQLGGARRRKILFQGMFKRHRGVLSQGILGLCCLIETRDHIEIITRTALLFKYLLWHLLHRFPVTNVKVDKTSHATHGSMSS